MTVYAEYAKDRPPPLPVKNMVRIAVDCIRKGCVITAVTIGTEDHIPRQYAYERVERIIFMDDKKEVGELAVIGLEPGCTKNSTRIFKRPTMFDFRTSEEFMP